MKRGGKEHRGYRGGEAYQGHGDYPASDDQPERVNPEIERYRDEMDDSQGPWDPNCDYNEYDSNTDEDDLLN